ncbi:MAG: hypothetical protein JWN95_1620 [Frankiales bacterium]|nr:hypothetical protein [Frankiales bacterium]
MRPSKSRLLLVALLAMTVAVPLSLPLGADAAATSLRAKHPVTAASTTTAAKANAASQLSASTRLADRRSVVIGDRFYEVGAEDGSYPAEGFHTRGEMGGFWTQPIKLLDGVWFGVDGNWLTASKYTNAWGYAQLELGTHDGVSITRTDFAPDGIRAGLIGLTLTSPSTRTLNLALAAHSELMKVYPWGETTPSQTTYNLPDTGAFNGKQLQFREVGTPPVTNAEKHDYAAVVGSSMTPTSYALGPNFRGPQSADVTCPASGPNAPEQPARCDDTAYGKGTGGQLNYQVHVRKGTSTIWFAVGGSDQGLAAATQAQRTALANPAKLLAIKKAQRQQVNSHTDVSLPGDPLLQQSVAWSKQNLADSVQQANDLQVRVSNAGTVYPPPSGTVAQARWIGAGWPDYPWIFGTDGEYIAFAAVASGQFSAIENHLRALRNVSLVANGNSGKVVHEVTPDGQVYFGANNDAGNTDETAKFASAVALVWRWTGDNRFRDEMYTFAKANLAYIYRVLDVDGDGWPEGLGNVERPGMGEEKLDNTVYTIRGLRDLADMAASKRDTATYRWATTRADDLESRFDATWWEGGDAHQYADSLANPDNTKVFQRHWIGVTPVEAEIVRPGQPAGPLAPKAHAEELVASRESPCYSGQYGLYHTGTGATTDPAGNPGPTCDSTVSSVASLRQVFTLNTSIMAVAEGALGRMAPGQLPRYTDGNATVQLDPAVSELPGAMPEIAPSPDFVANIDQKFTERSQALQAWGTYGVLWPVVHFELGVAPDLGRGQVAVIPQIPDGQPSVSGRDIRLGRSSIDVTARRTAHQLSTVVTRHGKLGVTLGAVLPLQSTVHSVTLNGRRVAYRLVATDRGQEVQVRAAGHGATSRLTITLD